LGLAINDGKRTEREVRNCPLKRGRSTASTCKDDFVYTALLGERATDLRDLLPVVEVLDGLLETDGDE
jgi:hypothetical protein